MTKDADFKKQVRARMATTGEAYTTARMQLLKQYGRQASPAGQEAYVLHVTNGDSVVHSLRDSGLSGDVLPWRDALHEGPVPGAVSAEELRSIRTRYVASQWKLSYDEVLGGFVDRDRALERARSGEYL